MSRIGTVIETRGDRALVATSRRGICADCADRSTCSIENALGKDTPDEIEVLNPIGARPGQTVEFDLPGHAELKVSLLIWAVPIVGLIAGAAAGAKLLANLGPSTDLATLIGAVAGISCGFAIVVACDRKAARRRTLVPRIKKIVNPATCPDLPRSSRALPRSSRALPRSSRTRSIETDSRP